MVNLRMVQFSHDFFWGFNRIVDLDEVDLLQDIIDMMYIKLMTFLKKENFKILMEKLEKSKKNLHIHNHTLGNILINDSNDIIYICGHGSHDNSNDSSSTGQAYGTA